MGERVPFPSRAAKEVPANGVLHVCAGCGNQTFRVSSAVVASCVCVCGVCGGGEWRPIEDNPPA